MAFSSLPVELVERVLNSTFSWNWNFAQDINEASARKKHLALQLVCSM